MQLQTQLLSMENEQIKIKTVTFMTFSRIRQIFPDNSAYTSMPAEQHLDKAPPISELQYTF